MDTKQPRNILIAFTLAAVISFVGGLFHSPAIATTGILQETGYDACFPLDIVFIIDQSNSMDESDPTKQRVYAIQAMIDQLAFLTTQRCPGVTYRVQVISFSENATLDLPLSPIGEDNAELKAQLNAETSDWTNPKPAFISATHGINIGVSAPEIRKRAIIFITDGQPCVSGWCNGNPRNSRVNDVQTYAEDLRDQVNKDFPFDAGLLAQEQCLARARETAVNDPNSLGENTNKCLETHRLSAEAFNASTYIWTLMLKPTYSYPEELREIYVQISRQHAGDVIDLSQNRNDIATAIRTIIDQLVGVRATRLRCGTFAVNPYLKQATFDFYKFDETIKVRLSYEDTEGVVHTLSDENRDEVTGFDVQYYGQVGANERYVLNTPYPGIWQLESESCESFDAFYEYVSIDPQVNGLGLPTQIYQYDRAPYFDPSSAMYVAYQIRDSSGALITPDPRFPIDVILVVTQPDQSDNAYAMPWINEEKIYRAEKALSVPLAGTYGVTWHGTFLEHTGDPMITTTTYAEVFTQPRELFLHTYTFDVLSIHPFASVILSPLPQAQLERELGDESYAIPVVVQLIDKHGDPVRQPDAIFSDLSHTFTATLTDRNNTSLQSMSLSPSHIRPGAFEGAIIIPETIQGDLVLTVQLVGQPMNGYRPSNVQASTSFSLSNVDVFSSNQLGLDELAYVCLALFGAMGIYRSLIRRRLSGYLVFLGPKSESLEKFNLNKGLVWFTVPRHFLRENLDFDLQSLTVKRLGAKNTAIRVQYVKRSEPGRHSITLQSNRAEHYSEKAPLFRMAYYPVKDSSE